MPERNVFSWNTIIAAHIRSQNLTQARALFDSAPYKDLVTYNSMLSGYVSADGYETHALKLFWEMKNECENVGIDEFTATRMLNLCAKLLKVAYGRQLHAFMVKTSNDVSGFAVSSLIDLYSKCACFQDAYRVFDRSNQVVDLVSKNAVVAAYCREGEMEIALKIFWREPELNDVVSWNTLISGYVQNGYLEEGLKLFVSMADNGVRWNKHTFASILSACSGLRSLKCGKEVHARVLKNGFISNPFISTGIVDMYCKCENMTYAELIHLTGGIENKFSITSLIVEYSSQGKMVEARRFFDSVVEKNVIVWTAMFSGYVKAQQCEGVFELLRDFIAEEAIVLEPAILLSLLGACALQAALNPGKEIHAYTLRMGVEMDKKLISSVTDMYSKCGNMTYAEKVFQSVTESDSILYNMMIAGYAHHGHETKAIRLFEEMLENGIKPDASTFVAILSACRHCGLVELGEKYFNSMAKDYNILPEIDHYGCMIDLYGRAHQLEKAVEFTERIPIKQDPVILGAFLNACRLNRNAKLARQAEEKLKRMEGDTRPLCVQLANVYAAEGIWDDVGRIRKQMRRKNVKKFAACSWLYLENRVHIFTSGDRSHSRAEAIYSMLASLSSELYDEANDNEKKKIQRGCNISHRSR